MSNLNAENSFRVKSAKPELKAAALACTYLEEHYAENISLDELTQLVNTIHASLSWSPLQASASLALVQHFGAY